MREREKPADRAGESLIVEEGGRGVALEKASVSVSDTHHNRHDRSVIKS